MIPVIRTLMISFVVTCLLYLVAFTNLVVTESPRGDIVLYILCIRDCILPTVTHTSYYLAHI